MRRRGGWARALDSRWNGHIHISRRFLYGHGHQHGRLLALRWQRLVRAPRLAVESCDGRARFRRHLSRWDPGSDPYALRSWGRCGLLAFAAIPTLRGGQWSQHRLDAPPTEPVTELGNSAAWRPSSPLSMWPAASEVISARKTRRASRGRHPEIVAHR